MSRILRVTAIIFMLAAGAFAQQKKRVAVMDFDYGTVRNEVQAIWGTNQDVGKGISDLLVTKLLQDGKYSIIERKALDKLLAEQDFGASGRVDAGTAAKIGKLLGVDAIIVGSITRFGRDDKNTRVGGGIVSWHGIGGGGVGKKESKAVCDITARIVDVTTGEILASATGTGVSKRSGLSLIGAGAGGGTAAGGGFDMSSSNFAQTILGEAVTQSVSAVGAQLDAASTNLPEHRMEVSGLVADVSGNTLILNVGSKAGLRMGDKLEISRPLRKVTDPATGKVLKTITSKVGDATVTELDADSATVSFTGTGPAKVGDVAKNNP